VATEETSGAADGCVFTVSEKDEVYRFADAEVRRYMAYFDTRDLTPTWWTEACLSGFSSLLRPTGLTTC
jgi:hypothetical protein